MRARKKDSQYVWFASVSEEKNGFSTFYSYGKPSKKLMSVSSGTGMPGQISAGIVVDYDREIVNYDHDFIQMEGNAVWVDVVPQLDDSGNLSMKEDGISPVTPPDYKIKQIFRTAKGSVDVFGIKKIGGTQ